MPLHGRLKRFKQSVTARLGTFSPGRSAARFPDVLPNLPASENPSVAPHENSASAQPKAKTTTAAQENTAGPAEQELSSLPALVLTQTTGEVIPLSHHASTAGSRQTKPQRSFPRLPTAVSTTAAQSVSAGGWAGLKRFLGVLESTGVFGPLKTVLDEFITCLDIFERAATVHDEFKALQGELEGLFEDLQQHFSRDASPTVTASMESLCKSILRELSYVKNKQGRNMTARRHQEAREGADSTLACYRRIQSYLQRLSLNSNLSMWKIVDEQTTDSRLDRLCPSLSACYNSRQAVGLKRGECTPGTRVDVLGQTHTWVYNRAAGSVYWLNGMAGTGKTTIAYSLCKELDAAHNLGASFFCSRLLPECRDVNQIVPSVAYQLARFSRPFRSALARMLEKERDVHTQLLPIQFETLVVKPLFKVRHTLPEDLVVVIDALDECDDKESTSHILEALLTKTSDLPIKFFLASRPEPAIRDQMKRRGGRRAISRLVLHELDKGTVQGDIKTYLRTALHPISPSELDITELVHRAGILFIYAATVVRYIGYDNFGRNPRSRLEAILSISTSAKNQTYKEIDEVYRIILKAAIDDSELDDQEREDLKQVLYTVLCAREPLTINVLSGLLDLDDIERIHAALRPLWSVLHVVESSELVTPLHASFPDYMFDPNRSKDYCCDRAMQDQVLARCCFRLVLEAKPEFNICGLESSYVRDDQIESLGARVDRAISQELAYACRHWATHLERARDSPELIGLLEDFLSTRLLLWMEIMNLKKCMNVGIGVIRQAEEWCLSQVCPEGLAQLTRDAWRFVAAFTLSPVSQCTPHIYVSMLAFWPKSSPIAKNYSKHTQGRIVPQGPAIDQEWLKLLATWPIDGKVQEVGWSADGTQISLVAGGQTFILDAVTGRVIIGPLQPKSSLVQSIGISPDGLRIVHGAKDGTIGVWDARSGHITLGPLHGHVGSVTFVAFSPDNARIISGSGDDTIRLWDARSGRTVLGPLKGHTSPITPVAFSPDGTRIAYGSKDKTIRMWDARSGRMVPGSLKGHADSVTSVKFSPDGTRIVSGSDDMTICVWDSRAGQLLFGPLKGHTDSITSIAFSPDGAHILSSSKDMTIRMWDARNGQLVLGPLEGHTNSMKSATFSPDGTHIVSISRNNIIRKWDARSGQTELGPLEGHAKRISSIALSPDGTRIVSASDDNTISMWDARSRYAALGPLEGHSNSVTSIALSSNGTRIVSGSWDKTICMWDAGSGQRVLGPLKGHTNLVTSVALSPDSTRIVSGSYDNTVRIWDARSGTALHLLKGHNDQVTSVAFSPDGTRVVSGSSDRTMRIWDARTGRLIRGPLTGHTNLVTSIAFSPDSMRIASGSGDNTILMWDARRGQVVLGPLEGHTSWVTSVAFSPDGTRIVSSSDDMTIRIWDARSGRTVLGPLKCHTDSVSSVMFSPDGTRIVSGSYDSTIFLWDARNGQIVLGPLERHSNWVTSVAFSPDGTQIISGSKDNTICVWDVRNQQTLLAPPSSFSAFVPISWKINADGWVVDSNDDSNLLVWVPADLRHVLLPPRNILHISPNRVVGLNFIDVRIGESWAEHYQSI